MRQKYLETLHALERLKNAYKIPPDEKLALYAEKLQTYALENVKAAIEKTIDTWEPNMRVDFPPLPVLLKLCESGEALNRTAKAVKSYRDNTATADSVMQTDFGQMALREGWAQWLWVEIMRTGRTDYGYEDAEKFRDGFQKAVQAAVACEVPQNSGMVPQIARSMLSIWQMNQVREKALALKYLNAV